jgi:hypothetical protein
LRIGQGPGGSGSGQGQSGPTIEDFKRLESKVDTLGTAVTGLTTASGEQMMALVKLMEVSTQLSTELGRLTEALNQLPPPGGTGVVPPAILPPPSTGVVSPDLGVPLTDSQKLVLVRRRLAILRSHERWPNMAYTQSGMVIDGLAIQILNMVFREVNFIVDDVVGSPFSSG